MSGNLHVYKIYDSIVINQIDVSYDQWLDNYIKINITLILNLNFGSSSQNILQATLPMGKFIVIVELTRFNAFHFRSCSQDVWLLLLVTTSH